MKPAIMRLLAVVLVLIVGCELAFRWAGSESLTSMAVDAERLASAGDIAAAEGRWLRITERHPGDPRGWTGLGELLLVHRRDAIGAELAFTRACTTTPPPLDASARQSIWAQSVAHAWRGRGDVLRAAGREASAEECYRMGRQIEASHAY